jgi:dihydrofolate reductase
MRKLILSMNISLDGYVEAADKDMTWLQLDDNEQWEGLFDMLMEVDLFLLGSGMWTEYRDYWKKALAEPGFSQNEVKYAKLAEQTKHLVFSNTLKDAGWHNTEIVSGSLKDAISALKNQPGKNIQIVGGAEFAGSVIDSGLVDEYRLEVNPVILGSGKSFFDGLQNRHSLELTDVKRHANEVVVLTYRQLDTIPTGSIKPGQRRSTKRS